MTNDKRWDKGWYVKWIYFVIDALNCLNRKYLKWDILPNAGGYYDQDFMIMHIWEAVKEEYIKCVNDKGFVKCLEGNK